jgi:hypothetical protein
MASSPEDFVGLLNVACEGKPTADIMSRYLCTIAAAIEERTNFCSYCGTRVRLWEPAVYDNGKEVGRQQTGHRWCPGCHNVVYNMVLAYMNVPQEYWA